MPIFSSDAFDDDADDLVRLHQILHGKGPVGRSVKGREGNVADRGSRPMAYADGKSTPPVQHRFGVSPREPNPEPPHSLATTDTSPSTAQISTRMQVGR